MLEFLALPIVCEILKSGAIVSVCTFTALMGKVIKDGGFKEEGEEDEGNPSPANSSKVRFYTVTQNKNKYKQYKDLHTYKPRNRGNNGKGQSKGL